MVLQLLTLSKSLRLRQVWTRAMQGYQEHMALAFTSQTQLLTLSTTRILLLAIKMKGSYSCVSLLLVTQLK